MYVYVSADACVRSCMCIRRSQKQPQVSFLSICLPGVFGFGFGLFFETGTLTGTEVTKAARLAGQQAP